MSDAEPEEMLRVCMSIQQEVSVRMVTHLQLTCKNLSETAWLSAGMLAKDAAVAQNNAATWLAHLNNVKRAKTSRYEQSWLDNSGMMKELTKFASVDPPSLLWRGHGAYQCMFKLLADRFLGAPDSVLDAEGVHAKWKWVEHVRRRIEFRMLNAVLRLTDYGHCYGGLPDYDELGTHLRIIQDAMRAQYDEVKKNGVVVPGLRTKYMTQDRFNLSPVDVDLLKEAAGKKAETQVGADVAWGNYVRFLFLPNHFYSLPGRDARNIFLVGETKALPGRNPTGHGGALSRSLAIAWFHEKEDCLQGMVVMPVSPCSDQLTFELVTIADICAAADPDHAWIGPEPSLTDRAREVLLEACFLDKGVLHYNSERVILSTGVMWNFVLKEPPHDWSVPFALDQPADVQIIGE